MHLSEATVLDTIGTLSVVKLTGGREINVRFLLGVPPKGRPMMLPMQRCDDVFYWSDWNPNGRDFADVAEVI